MKKRKDDIQILEDVFVEAYSLDLISFVKIGDDSIIIRLNECNNSTEKLHQLAKHIKKKYPSVMYFHFRRAAREMQIYHFKMQKHIMKLAEQEKTP